MSVVITVADIRSPAPGKKQASIIDSTGKRWGVASSEQDNYRQFGTYEITKFKESFFQGKTYYTIESAVSINATGTSATPPPAANATSLYKAPPSEDQRRMDIFVCGAFNNMMANSCVNPHELSVGAMLNLVNDLKDVWKKTLGPQPDPISTTVRPAPDMNDDIPF